MVEKNKILKNSTPVYFSILLFFIYYFLGTKYFLAAFIVGIATIFALIDFKIAIYGVTFIMPFLSNSLATMAFIGLGFLYFLKRIGKDKDSLINNPLVTIVLVYLLMILIQTITSVMPILSIRDLGLHLAGIIYFIVLINNIKTKKDLNTFLTVLITSAALVALIGLVQAATGVEMEREWVDTQNSPDTTLRVYSVFGNPNILAEYLVFITPICVGLFWHTKSLKKKTVFGLYLLVMFAALGLTMSRGGWVGIAMAALVFILLVDRRLLLLAVPIIILALVFLPQPMLNRLTSITNLSDTSNAYRLKIWEITSEIIKDHPIAGLGLGHKPFSEIFNTYIRTMPIAHAHNSYLQALVEYGIAGFTIFIMMLYMYIKNPIKYCIIKNKDDKYIKYVSAGAVAGLVGAFTHGLVEVILYMPKIIFSFWIVFAILNILYNLSTSKEVV